MLVCLKEIVAHDETVLEIANLPPGWVATREGTGLPWTRTRQYADATRILIDWSKIRDIDDFYDLVFEQCLSPEWHGRNLDAIADSWIAGGINETGPPYVFVFSSLNQTLPNLIQFRDAIIAIAQKSIDDNGGRLETPDEIG
jgi:RNAse (barnase) inhibitor barstar